MTETATTGRESLVVQIMSAEITVPSRAEVLLPPLPQARSCSSRSLFASCLAVVVRVARATTIARRREQCGLCRSRQTSPS